MPEPKTNSDVRTLAVRVSPAEHAQLAMVAQIDGITLVELMTTALAKYVAERRAASDFQEKAQTALAEAERQMAETRAMLLGTLPEGAAAEASTDAPATGRGRRKDEASG